MNNGNGIFLLWRGWALTTGAFALVILLSLWVPKNWLPFVAFALALLLHLLSNSTLHGRAPVCSVIPFIGTRTLTWTGVIMIVINFIYYHNYTLFHPNTVNPQIPYLTILIEAPVATLIAAWAVFRGTKISFCRNCIEQHGEPVERGFLGILFTQEGQYQVRMLAVSGSILSLITWGYYFFFYINININTPDSFFFCWLPILFTLATFFYLGVRYVSIYTYYCQNAGLNHGLDEKVTRLRYLVICGDEILLNHTRNTLLFTSVDRLDTPATITVPYRADVTDKEAENLLVDNTRLKDGKLRFMYKVTASSAESNMFHYIVTLTSADLLKGTTLEGGQWFTIQAIQQLMTEKKLTSLLCAEIVRLHDVTMAWKTYDREGRRLYKIRNYRPSFRLRDIDSWDVDFNDPLWLHISSCNQDKKFWRIRRFWQRYINGLR